ncbi:unnamed protein product [Jaminaea pallidilutea]
MASIRKATRVALSAPGPSFSARPGRRAYAQLVNRGTSVDPRLGIVPPPVPVPGGQEGKKGDTSFTVNPRPDNPNDLSDFLKPSSSSSPSSQRGGGPKATLQSVKGTAIGSRRPATGVPTDDLPLMPGEGGQKSQQQSPVDAQAIDREHPHAIDALSGRNELDERILNAARAAHASHGGSGLIRLGELYDQRSGRILPIELPYESTPGEDRKVPLPKPWPNSTNPANADVNASTPAEMTDDDGILLLAYVGDVTAPRGEEKISVCTGFAVEGGSELAQVEQGEADGHLVVSVAHTLRSAFSQARRSSPDEDCSAAVAITRKGEVYPVETLVSSLSTSDLVLLRIPKQPLPIENSSAAPSSSSASSASSSQQEQQQQERQMQSVKTLPISPYPSPAGSHLLVSSFWGFEDDSSCALPPFSFSPSTSSLSLLPQTSHPDGRSPEQVRREGDAMSQSRWGEVRLIEYRDSSGSEAQTGTYDSLETMEYKLVQNSLINPKILRGETLAFVPGVGSAPSINSNSSSSSSSSDAVSSSKSTTQGGSEPTRGFGGYGVPSFPPPGSSGGPIVDAAGAVVGVTRGSKMSTVGGRRGEAIPSEKLWEFFTLPGMGKKVK